jgi:hypothetical protein
MVKGLEVFRNAFSSFLENYVLIGGTAASIVMEEAGLDFRATKDLDIVILLERLDGDFVSAVWDFIDAGGYEHRQRSDGREQFYRFQAPATPGFPEMLELFSRLPDALPPRHGSALTPVVAGGEAASLSAILLDQAYYGFICEGARVVEGLSVIGPDRLIPLKARAWLDLKARRAAGEPVDERDVRKHRNDILRLSRVVDPASPVQASDEVARDLRVALRALATEPDLRLRDLGMRNTNLEEVLAGLKSAFNIVDDR